MLRIISPTFPNRDTSRFVILSMEVESEALLDQLVRKC